MASSKSQLRKRCPVCKKLRGFREPSGDTWGEYHPNRKPWAKIEGRWVCGWCAGTETGVSGRGTVPHHDEVLKTFKVESQGAPGSLNAGTTETDTERYQISANTVFVFWNESVADDVFESEPGETWFAGRQKAAIHLHCGVEDLTWRRKG